jgi:truncated hemoglobin YjbI
MTRLLFERHIPGDRLLAPLFADMPPGHPQRAAAWLGEVLGGPESGSPQPASYPQMAAQDPGRALTREQQARWVALASDAADEAGLPADPEFRSAFSSYIEWDSRHALENSEPAAKPPEKLNAPRWDWGAAGPPPAPAETDQQAQEQPGPPLPGPAETVSFAAHIKPLFRQRDRQSMTFAFDLWSCDDVAARAADILGRLGNGSMPCDGPWPNDKIEVFRRWTESGMRP